MKLSKWLSSGGSESRQANEQDVRMSVTNVTRKTLLARNAEVAKSGAKRSKGLLGRKGLAAWRGYVDHPLRSCTHIRNAIPDRSRLYRSQTSRKEGSQ